MFPSLVAKFARHRLKPARVERRARKRVVPAQITPCQLTTSDGAPVDNALIQDLSANGAGIISEQGFAAGTIVDLLLVNANHTFAVSVEYEVLHCQQSPSGTFFLGGRFCRPLDHEQIVPLLN